MLKPVGIKRKVKSLLFIIAEITFISYTYDLNSLITEYEENIEIHLCCYNLINSVGLLTFSAVRMHVVLHVSGTCTSTGPES